MKFTECQERTITELENARNRIALQQSNWLQSVKIINKSIKEVEEYTEEIMSRAHKFVAWEIENNIPLNPNL